MKKNLIIGTACNYTKSDMELFVRSWKDNLGNVRLIIIVDIDVPKDTLSWLKQMGVEVYYFNARFFIPSEIHNTRYFKYLDIILEQRESIDRVFLTDVGDVFFQGNIFEEIEGDGLHCFAEDLSYTCGTEGFNKYVINSFYGKEVLDSLYDKPVICSGTTLGDVESIIKYLVSYMDQLSVHSLMNSWARLGGDLYGFDQAVHIYLMYYVLNPKINDNGIGVGTLKMIPPEKVKVIAKKVFVSNKIPSVIHQWDRHQEIINILSVYKSS